MQESDNATRLFKLAMAMTLFRGCPQINSPGVNNAVKLHHTPVYEVNESADNHRAAKSGLRKQKPGQTTASLSKKYLSIRHKTKASAYSNIYTTLLALKLSEQHNTPAIIQQPMRPNDMAFTSTDLIS
jgi:hypothetical protein